jgi:hypothetical protein
LKVEGRFLILILFLQKVKSTFEGWREEGGMVFLFFHLLLFINYLLLFFTLEGEGEHGFIIFKKNYYYS